MVLTLHPALNFLNSWMETSYALQLTSIAIMCVWVYEPSLQKIQVMYLVHGYVASYIQLYMATYLHTSIYHMANYSYSHILVHRHAHAHNIIIAMLIMRTVNIQLYDAVHLFAVCFIEMLSEVYLFRQNIFPLQHTQAC